MLLKVYGLRDSIALETKFLLTAPSLEILGRNVKNLMLSGSPIIMENLQDNSIWELGELDTSTNILTGLLEPVQVYHCLELFHEAKAERKAIYGEDSVKEIER